MRIKKVTAADLTVFLLLSGASCGGYTPLAEPDYSTSTKQLHIGAWVAPPPAYTEQKYFDLAAESGITVLYQLYAGKTEEALACCEKAGIKYYVRDENISTLGNYVDENGNFTANESEIEKIKEQFSYVNSPAFAGHLVKDEPKVSELNALGTLCEAYQKVFPNATYYINLYPSVAGNGRTGASSYTEYISTYLNTVKNGILSYDSYPLYQDGWGKSSLEESYLSNIQTIAVMGKNAGVDYWSFVQCCNFSATTRAPSSVADITFQYYTYLAYGFTGLQEFCFWTPDDTTEIFSNSMIDRMGNKTDIFEYVKAANLEVQALAPIYLNYEWQGTMPVLGSKNTKNALFNQVKSETLAKQLGATVPESHERIKTVTSDEDILVGLFKDREYDGFLVTNFTDPGADEPKTATVEISFNKATKAVVIEKGERRVVDLESGTYTASIGSGSAQFIIPFN